MMEGSWFLAIATVAVWIIAFTSVMSWDGAGDPECLQKDFRCWRPTLGFVWFCIIWILISPYYIILTLDRLDSIFRQNVLKHIKPWQVSNYRPDRSWLVLLMRICFNPPGCRKCTARSWPTSSSSKDEKISEGRRAVDMPGPKFHHRWQTSK